MKSIKNVDFRNKKVIIRCDFNVPIKDNKILDDNRIKMSLETINYIKDKASKIILLSHLGRIKTLEDKKNKSLKIIIPVLEDLIKEKIGFYDYTDNTKSELNKKIVLFENTRFFDLDNNKESDNDIDLSKYFASFADIYVNDAFAVSHRKNASNYGITNFLPSYNGFLVEKEINMLNNLLDNIEKPYIVILGGSKVKDKIGVINNLIEKVDKIIISGAMAFTFLYAKNYEVGKSIVDTYSITYAKDLLNKYGNKIILIKDCYVSKNLEKEKKLKSIEEINIDEIGYDIGPKTIKEYENVIKEAKTIFFNGPVGLFENEKYEYGTKEIIKILNNTDAKIIIGGGDTVNAAKKYKIKNAYLSTGGGAALKYLEDKNLPGIIL